MKSDVPGTHIGVAVMRIAVKRHTKASTNDWCFKRKQIAAENSLSLKVRVMIVPTFATTPKHVMTN